MLPTQVEAGTSAAEHALVLAKIYRAHRAHVRAQLRGFGVRDAALDDVLHDAFVIAFRKLAGFEPSRGSLRAWLVGIAWRVAAAHRRGVHHFAAMDDCEIAADMPDPEAYAARSEAAHVLDRLLRALPPEQAAAFVMSELEGLSGAEIAEHWHIAPATAYTRVARARLKMQAELERAKYGRRPWWAMFLWPRTETSSGLRIAAAFASLRALALIVAAIVLIATTAWWVARAGESSTDATIANGSDASRTSALGSEPERRDAEFGPSARHASIAGRVRALAGQGIAGAEVCAWPEIVEHGTRAPICSSSDANGRFRLDAVVPSRYRVAASARGFAPGEAAGGSERGLGSIAVRATEQRDDVDIVLAPGGLEIRGVVSDAFGGPVEGARVTITSVGGPSGGPSWGLGVPVHATATGEGEFSAWVTRGAWKLAVQAEGYADASTSMQAPGPTLRVRMVPESTLAGIVVERESKRPIAGARVVLREWSDSAASDRTVAFTDDAGRFAIDRLAPGRYRPAAFADGMQGESARSHVVELAESLDGVVIEMTPAAALLARVVTLPDGAPCPSGDVTLWDRAGEVARVASIAPDGSASFDGLTPGQYGVVVACHDHSSADVPLTHAIEGVEPSEVTWSVTRGHAVRGRVVDARGKPLIGSVIAYAASTGPDGAFRWARIDADGRYAVLGLTPGQYSMDAHVEGPRLSLSAEVVDRDVELDFHAEAVQRLVGRVTRGDQPAVGVDVSAMSRPGYPAMATTADDGTFVFEALPTGTHRISARDALGNASAETSVVVDSEVAPQDVTLALPASLDIRGVVQDEDGSPLADALVSATWAASPQDEAARRSDLRTATMDSPGTAISDSNGEFTLSGIAPDGAYSVVAQRRGGGSAAREGVRAGANVELRLAATATVRGRVRAASGPTALWIELHSDEGLTRQRESFFLGDGAFEIANLDPGAYDVRATAREGRARVRVDLKANATNDVTLELVGSRTIHGRFVDFDTGAPLPGVYAIFDEEDASMQRIAARTEQVMRARVPGLLSDAQGEFAADGVPPTTAQLFAISMGFQIAAPDDKVIEVMLIPQSSSADGVVDIPIAKPRVRHGERAGELGFTLADMSWPCRESLRVERIEDPTTAEGLRAGDEIVAIDGQDVAGLRCYLGRVLLRVPPARTVALGLARGVTVQLTTGAADED